MTAFNPVVYTFASSDFREAFKNSMTCVKKVKP
jgi:hypothetical protein